ncbi:MAG: hypothetical protein LBE12_03745 [Planctomycetaceae bacterium]|jgi:hypothetical protein|nr:hypothetical protein [Planctomycetaceae bacterium]
MTKKIFVLVLLTIICASCNTKPKLERPNDLPELHPCSITVTFGGKILEGVLVTLIPEDGSKWKPNATTDSNGTSKPNASFGFTGVPQGKYTVAFTLITDNPDYDDSKTHSRRFRSLIPLKYQPGKSTEKVEIKAGEKNVFSFALDAGEELVR